MLPVEVVYACPQRQLLLALKVAPGTTVAGVVEQSGILQCVTGVDTEQLTLGVFGRVCEPERVVAAGDRVEIYRPLQQDPKTARRRRAENARQGG